MDGTRDGAGTKADSFPPDQLNRDPLTNPNRPSPNRPHNLNFNEIFRLKTYLMLVTSDGRGGYPG